MLKSVLLFFVLVAKHGFYECVDFCGYAGQIADDAAVASYHLNGGDCAYDSSPNGNTGTVNGASTVTGFVNSSTYSHGLNFNSNEYDYVNVPDSYSLDLSSAVSVEAWIKPSRLNVWQSPLEKGAHNDWAYGFYIGEDGRLGFEIGIEGQTVQWAGAVAPTNTYLAVGKWSYIVGTADTATHKVRLYIDGVKVAENTFSGQINTNSIPFQIGKRYDGGYFGGIIDEVRIYDRALSACEIYSHYAANIPNHWLTVDTVPFPTIPSISEIMIDGQYAGFKPYSVPINYHTVEVPEYFELPPPYGRFTFDHYIIDGNTVYTRIVTWAITKDTVVTAYYRWGY